MPKPSRKGISAAKRLRQSIKARDRNKSVKSRTRTLMTKALQAISGDVNTAEASVRDAVSSLDKAAQKGVIHPNAAARGKARLLKRFNLAVAGAVAAAATAAAAPSAPAGKPEATPKAARRRATGRAAAAPAEEKPAAKRPARSRAAPKAEESKPAPRSRARKTT